MIKARARSILTMETQVRTPQMIFMQPQRLTVPLFQRPYVWNEESQWEPLWKDVVRVAQRLLDRPFEKHHPHFLGAVVLQHAQKQIGQMQERTIIDGQQRLTTLQLLLDALHAELWRVGAKQQALRIEPLVTNADAFCLRPEDRFKVWPTNRDRDAFNVVMAAVPPIDYEKLNLRSERLVAAHRFFSDQTKHWLSCNGSDAIERRATAIETAVRELLQIVVIDLGADENAQEIFETLNARGAHLSAADLIKNFVFQRLLEAGADVDQVYQKHWKEFETGFWEAEVSVGRLRYPRSAIFLNHWLVARTGEEIVAREVFNRFKRFVDDVHIPMLELLSQINSAADVYRRFVRGTLSGAGSVGHLNLFGYRTGVLESEVIKPLILYLLSPEETLIPTPQLDKALDAVESWMVRRMLVRATTKAYGQVIAELIARLKCSDRAVAGDEIEKFLAAQSGASRYWPDDNELKHELLALQAYRRIGRGRLRMVFEAIEDYRRGWRDGKTGLASERAPQDVLAIEHIMPRRWQHHWPLPAERSEADRERLIHTLGNLTLLTGKLNSKMSNAAWLGDGGKKSALTSYDILLLNRDILQSDHLWSDDNIRERTLKLIQIILQIWPVPLGHQSGMATERSQPHRRVDLLDLIAGGLLEPGATLIPRVKRFEHRTATLLPDGTVGVDGVTFANATEAASHIYGKRKNGWWFFLTDPVSRRSLKAVKAEYINSLAIENDEPDDEDDEDE
jgi:hypothetical protein